MAFFRSDIKPSGLSVDTLAVTTLPTKVSYTVGETLDTTGIVVTATASGMSGDVSSSCTYSPTTLSTAGTVAITVNYCGTTTTFNVTVEEQIGTLEQTSWATIQQVGAQGQGSQYWAVGDTKSLTVNGTVGILSLSNYSTTVIVIGFNHNSVNGVYFQCFYDVSNSKRIAMADSSYTSSLTDGTKAFNWNHWGAKSYGGWKGCDLRYDILGSTDTAPSGYGSIVSSGRTGYDASSTTATNPVSNTLMAALPSALRAVMAPMTIYSDNVGETGASADVTSSVDYLPLLSEFELMGKYTSSSTYEQNYQKQFDYYKNGVAKLRIAYKHNAITTKALYLLRSYARASNSEKFCAYVSGNGTSGESSSYVASKISGLTPIFRVA